jgi:hypothetical protein
MSFFHPLAGIRASLKRIEDALARPTRKEIEMSAQLDRLITDTATIKTLAQSTATFIAGLAGQIHAGSGDQATMEALATDLEASAKTISDALVANTPVAPSGLGAGPVAATPPAAIEGFGAVVARDIEEQTASPHVEKPACLLCAR